MFGPHHLHKTTPTHVVSVQLHSTVIVLLRQRVVIDVDCFQRVVRQQQTWIKLSIYSGRGRYHSQTMSWLLRLMITVTVLLTVWNRGGCSAKPFRHHISHKRLKSARIKAIKQEILTKLGLSSEPIVSQFNTTIQEKRRMVKLYKKSIDESQGKLHKLFSDEEFYAKKFHSFTDTGKHWFIFYTFLFLLFHNYYIMNLCYMCYQCVVHWLS